MKKNANQIRKVTTEINAIVDGEFVLIPTMYKVFTILTATINVHERSTDNIIIIIENGTDDRYYVGLDDSKSNGNRRYDAVNFEDAINYVEWVISVRKSKLK